MNSVPQTSMVAATECAGLGVAEVDTTIACCARRHRENNSVGFWTGLDTSEREQLWNMETLRSGSILKRVGAHPEHLGYAAGKCGPRYS